MAAKQIQSRIFNAPVHIIANLLKSPNFMAAVSLTVSSYDDYMMVYRFKHDISFSSWGENITIQLTPVAENVTNMNIVSECAMPTQVIDWGKNSENINRIMNYMEYAVPSAMMATPVQNAVPQQGFNQQPPMINQVPQGYSTPVCRNCGAQLINGALFCTNCGTRVGV